MSKWLTNKSRTSIIQNSTQCQVGDLIDDNADRSVYGRMFVIESFRNCIVENGNNLRVSHVTFLVIGGSTNNDPRSTCARRMTRSAANAAE